MKNTGTSYELLAKAIFQQLLEQDEVETIRLEHNVTFQGKTTTHQIDVYWEFKVGAVVYHTCVQAKDWGQPVQQAHVMTFKSVLDDLPFRATGIMVSRSGYQSGAKEFAEGNGIGLYELRQMQVDDWVGRIRSIQIKLEAMAPYARDFKPHADEAWFKNESSRLGLKEGEQISIAGYTKELSLSDESGKVFGTFDSIVDSHLPRPLVEKEAERISLIFDTPVFVQTTHPILKQIKLTGFDITIGVSKMEQEILLNGDDIVHFILKNVLDDTAHVFTKDKKLIEGG